MPSEIVYEDEKIIAFKDIHPVAPVHILVVPKKHIPSLDHLEVNDKTLIGDLFLVTQGIARSISLAKSGYKLAFNVGRGGGQLIGHLHLHLIGGWKSEKERKIPGMP